MRFISTNRTSPPSDLKGAILKGLAPDGGLYTPESIPQILNAGWASFPEQDLPSVAEQMLGPYLNQEVPRSDLLAILKMALNFPIPLVPLGPRIFLLELFHGPTLAFKDVGARCLARLLEYLNRKDRSSTTIVVATSGDTGGAVADAFFKVPGTRVLVLYPENQISRLQEHQIGSPGENVLAIAVKGTFDDCQRLVKRALGERNLIEGFGLTSANSINIGRLLPQIVYYAWAIAQLPIRPSRLVFCVPSGNLGNLTAGLLSQRMGLPCDRFVAAVNANDVLPEFLGTGRFEPRECRRTLATAMDVGNPSNMARLRAMFDDDVEAMRRAIWTSGHDDAEISSTIRSVFDSTGVILDPHTAVGYAALEKYLIQDTECEVAILLATAHPAKFPEVISSIIGESPPPQGSLLTQIARPIRKVIIPPCFDAFCELLTQSEC